MSPSAAPPAQPSIPAAVGGSGAPRISPEQARMLRRVGANYARLAVTFTLGILLVPVLLVWVGVDGFGLLSVIGSGIGLTTMVLEVLDRATIRELGEAHHSGDADRFARVYNSALLVSWVAAAAFAATCALLLPLVSLLNIPDSLVPAARWVAVGEAVWITALLALAPANNMYQVTERFVAYNVIVAVQRSTYIVTAVFFYYILRMRPDPGTALTCYAIGSGALNLAAVVVPVTLLMVIDPRLRPRLRRADRASARLVLRSFRSVGLVVLIVSSLERLSVVLGNLCLPSSRALGWNAAFGLSQRAVGNVRIAAEGFTRGLDAVSARLSFGEESGAGVRGLARSMTRLHALIALPAAAALFVLAEPALVLWIGWAVPNPAVTIPRAVPMVQIMVFGLAARAISDAWLSILYGAGHIGRVARVFFAAGLVTPVAVAALTLALPEPLDELGPALAVAGSMVLIQFVVFVVPAARAMDASVRDLLGPVVRPAIAAAIASVVPIAALLWIPRWTLPGLVGVLGLFGIAYASVAWIIALSSSERRRVVGLVRGRLPFGAGAVARPDVPPDQTEGEDHRLGPDL